MTSLIPFPALVTPAVVPPTHPNQPTKVTLAQYCATNPLFPGTNKQGVPIPANDYQDNINFISMDAAETIATLLEEGLAQLGIIGQGEIVDGSLPNTTLDGGMTSMYSYLYTIPSDSPIRPYLFCGTFTLSREITGINGTFIKGTQVIVNCVLGQCAARQVVSPRLNPTDLNVVQVGTGGNAEMITIPTGFSFNIIPYSFGPLTVYRAAEFCTEWALGY